MPRKEPEKRMTAVRRFNGIISILTNSGRRVNQKDCEQFKAGGKKAFRRNGKRLPFAAPLRILFLSMRIRIIMSQGNKKEIIVGTQQKNETANRLAYGGVVNVSLRVDWLILRIGSGDLHALETLYDGLKNSVYSAALAILKDPAAAEDVLQDTFLRVCRAAPSYTPGVNGRAWVMTIARNLSLDRLKKKDRLALPLDEAAEPAAFAGSTDFIDDIELREALGSLAPEEREIVLLHLASGFKFREIAELLHTEPGKVHWKYYSAIRRLGVYYGALQEKGVGLGAKQQG